VVKVMHSTKISDKQKLEVCIASRMRIQADDGWRMSARLSHACCIGQERGQSAGGSRPPEHRANKRYELQTKKLALHLTSGYSNALLHVT